MPIIRHPFQQWIDDNNIVDVRFYPGNPDATSALKLMDDAHAAVCAYEKGESKPYVDNIEEIDVETILS